MKTKKSEKADLERKRFLFFETGLIVALAIALAAFEWPSRGDLNIHNYVSKGAEPDAEIIPRTEPDVIKQPAPPIVTVDKIIIVEDDDEISPSVIDPFVEYTDDQYADLLKYIRPEEPDLDEVIDFLLIEIQPSFMGGGQEKFIEWVFKNLNYPDEAARNGIQGKVYIEFMIDIDGKVKNVKVLRSVDPLLDREAVRVVTSSPPWNPGYQRDKPAKVVFKFPIHFKLKN